MAKIVKNLQKLSTLETQFETFKLGKFQQFTGLHSIQSFIFRFFRIFSELSYRQLLWLPWGSFSVSIGWVTLQETIWIERSTEQCSVNSEHCGAIKDRDGMELGIFYKVFAEIGDWLIDWYRDDG